MAGSANSSTADRLWVTVLAGGIGSRFWPASTPARPKQLLPLASPRPLIVDTVERARALTAPQRIRVLTGSHLVEPFRRVLPELDTRDFLVEPEARGTAPVLVWAAHHVAGLDPDAVLVSLHADHLVGPEDAFVDTVRAAADLADREPVLVTLGAPPTRPETGYGYIRPGEGLEAGGARAFRVERFVEKPDAPTAAEYVTRGYRWNTGIFVWKASVFLDEVRTHAPDIARALPLLDEGRVEAFFEACPTVAVDVAVLERSDRVACVEAAFDWDDVGGWEALARTGSPDAGGNVVLGPGQAVDASGNIVYAEGAPVVLWGVDDLVVVRTGGMTLVAPRERTPELKRLLAERPESFRAPEVG